MNQSESYVSDRIEIDDLLTRYASALDMREWDTLDSVFTADAELDYRSAGGLCGTYPEIKAWLSEVLPMFTWTQHLVLNRAVELEPESEDAFHGAETAANLALVYALVGEPDEAITLIERLLSTPGAVQGLDFPGNITLAELRLRREWDSLRSNPRFQKILAGPEPKTVY